MGAFVGATIALVLYATYEAAAEHLQAYVAIPWTGPERHDAPSPRTVIADTTVEERTKDRLASRARAIAERFTQRPITDVAEDAIVESIEEPLAEPEASAAVQAVDVSRDAANVLSPPEEKKEEENTMKKEENAAKAPALPSSGVGTWLAGVFALLCAVGLKYRAVLYADIARL